jgi:hypothetical protein
MDLTHVGGRFGGAAHSGLGHDLEQRRAGTVQVDAARAMEVLVQRLAGVFLEMRARDMLMVLDWPSTGRW